MIQKTINTSKQISVSNKKGKVEIIIYDVSTKKRNIISRNFINEGEKFTIEMQRFIAVEEDGWTVKE